MGLEFELGSLIDRKTDRWTERKMEGLTNRLIDSERQGDWWTERGIER